MVVFKNNNCDYLSNSLRIMAIVCLVFICFIYGFRFLFDGMSNKTDIFPLVLEVYGSKDVSSQIYAYYISIFFIFMFIVFGFFKSNIKSNSDCSIFSREFLFYYNNESNNREGSFVFLLTYIFYTSIVLFLLVFFRRYYYHEFTIRASDPHIYTVMAQIGEGIFRGASETKSSGYGFALPLIYSILKKAGFINSYHEVFRVILALNVLFAVSVVFYFSMFIKRIKRTKFEIYLGVVLLLGPLLQIMIPDGYNVFSTNLSGYRFFPFLIVAIYSIVSENYSIYSKIIVSGFLSSVSIFLSQDTGLVAFVGFIGLIMLHDKLNYRSLFYAVIFITLSIAIFSMMSYFLNAVYSIDIYNSVVSSFKAGSSGYGGKAIRFLNPIWIPALCYVFTFIYFVKIGMEVRLPAVSQSAVVFSGMMLVWYMYYVYRPSGLYWIYYVPFFPLSLVVLSELSRLRRGYYKVIFLTLVAVVSVQVVLTSVRHVNKFYFHDLSAVVAGEDIVRNILTEYSFVNIIRERASFEAMLNRSDVQFVTALPYATSQMFPFARLPIETLFSFRREADLTSWRDKICSDLPSYLVFDGEAIVSFAPKLSDFIKKKLIDIFNQVYVFQYRTDEFEVWRLERNNLSIASSVCENS